MQNVFAFCPIHFTGTHFCTAKDVIYYCFEFFGRMQVFGVLQKAGMFGFGSILLFVLWHMTGQKRACCLGKDTFLTLDVGKHFHKCVL